jgi:predicted amidohydrolase
MNSLKIFWVILVVFSFVQCKRQETKTDIVVMGRAVDSSDPAKTVRVFSVAHKHTLEIGASEDAYYKKMKGMIEAVKGRISNTYTNIFVFPEDAGLVLGFLGSRGEKARSEDFALNAFFDLFESYSQPYNYYFKKFPSFSPQRYLLLALTDTLWRPFYNTFSSLAREYGSYVLSCTNVAEAILSPDPDDIAKLGDPDFPERMNVYVANSPDVWNTCFLFSPDGEIVHKTKKVYLVTEEKELLDLTNGKLEEVTTYNIKDTSINLCVGISLDAFKSDFVKHVDDLGCNVFLQPDANSGMWASFYPYWQPDDWLGSVMGTMQYSNIQYNVNPMMTGNFFDMVFDGQSAITAKFEEDIKRNVNYVGNEPLDSVDYSTKFPEGGFLLIGPWVMDDPSVKNPALTVEERRDILKQKSLALASSSACVSNELEQSLCGSEENQYVETILWADLVVR